MHYYNRVYVSKVSPHELTTFISHTHTQIYIIINEHGIIIKNNNENNEYYVSCCLLFLKELHLDILLQMIRPSNNKHYYYYNNNKHSEWVGQLTNSSFKLQISFCIHVLVCVCVHVRKKHKSMYTYNKIKYMKRYKKAIILIEIKMSRDIMGVALHDKKFSLLSFIISNV